MKNEEITKLLEDLNPSIEEITDPAIKAIITTLLSIINAQKKTIAELTEKLNTNSNNSSKPPSSDPPNNPEGKGKKKNKKRKQGGQHGHKGTFRELLPEEEVDHIETHNPPARCDCGSRIQLTGKYRRHQNHELPQVKAIVTEHQLHSGVCAGCGKIHRAELPAGASNGMLGARAMSKIAALTGDYRMSKRNVTFLLEDFYGLRISTGTVCSAEKTVSAALEKSVEEAKAFVPKQSRVHGDETGHAEKGKKMWTWAFIGSLVAVFIIRPSRGAQVAKDFLGLEFKGVFNSDRWSAYTWLAIFYRQLCWAHLKRDFLKISERSGEAGKIGRNLLACTIKMFRYWHKFKRGAFGRDQLKERMTQVQARIEILLENGSHCGDKKTAGTCKQLIKLQKALWTFLDKEEVEPTNNLAEQILRRIVIWRKTSFGTQSEEGTLYLERIMTVVSTCKLQKRNVLDFVTAAVHAHLGKTAPPSLLPIKTLENYLQKVA